jgi:acylglycerol lipase
LASPPLRRSESHLAERGRPPLFRRVWLPADPTRALLIVHGYAEHSGRYEHVGAWFAQRGFAVHAYDQRGHGRSGGRRCHVARFDELLDDLERVLARVRDEHPGLPLFLLGHSMGGLVVSAFARERRPELSGVVTTGAALDVGRAVSPMRQLALRALRHIVPVLSFESGIDPEGLATDPEVVRAYREDPLVHRRLTVALAAEMLAAARRTAAGGADLRLPLLALHGAEDPIAPAEGSAAFASAAPDAVFRRYEGMRHEILNESEREAVFRDILSWIGEQSPRSAGA